MLVGMLWNSPNVDVVAGAIRLAFLPMVFVRIHCLMDTNLLHPLILRCLDGP